MLRRHAVGNLIISHTFYAAQDWEKYPKAEEERVEFLTKLGYRAAVGNPGFPVPIKRVGDGELESELPASPSLIRKRNKSGLSRW